MLDTVLGMLGGNKGATTGNPMADAVLGGGGPMSGILGSMMGGTGNSMTSMLVTPIVKGITDKLGLPPIAAQLATAFVISKISGDVGAPKAQQSGILDMLGSIAGGGALDTKSPQVGSMIKDMSKVTGIKEEHAADGLSSIIGGLLKGVAS